MESEEYGQPLADPAEKLILLVDDDEGLLEMMEHIVKKEGFRTEKAADGREALAKAQSMNPDLLVLDFMLPGLGGYELLRELQASGCGNIPIVVVTGRPMDHKTIEMVKLESNVKEFMQKPVRPAAFASTLHVLLQTRPPEIDRAHARGGLR